MPDCVGFGAFVFRVGDCALGTELIELRKGIIDIAGHHVEAGANDKPTAGTGGNAGKRWHRRYPGWKALLGP